jgi:hypothetical protein
MLRASCDNISGRRMWYLRFRIQRDHQWFRGQIFAVRGSGESAGFRCQGSESRVQSPGALGFRV